MAVSSELNHCFFEAILCNVQPPTDILNSYTANHLRLQMCMYMIENPELCLNLLEVRLAGWDTSLYHFISKFLRFNEWGEHSLLLVIASMWNTTITVLDVTRNDFYETYAGDNEKHDHISDDIVIIYNGNSHYTGTVQGELPKYPSFPFPLSSFPFFACIRFVIFLACKNRR